MDDVEVRELRYFIAVAEELNFTRAAERLGMAQPPLSVAIGKLERKLGVKLLERTSRRITLTPAGATLVEQGRIAVECFGAALERTRRQGSRSDHLTVAVKAADGTGLLKKITERCAQNPQMPDVHILFGHRGRPDAAVRSGAADVAILRASLPSFDRRGLDTEILLTEPRVAVLAADHRLAGLGRLHRADLAGEPMPRWTGLTDAATTAYWAGLDAPTGLNPASAAETPEGPEVSDLNQLLDAVALGRAVAYLPASVAQRHSGAELVFVPVSDLSPSQVVAAWPDMCRSRAVASFVRAAVEVAASTPEQAAASA